VQAQDVDECAVHLKHFVRGKSTCELAKTRLRIDGTGLLNHHPCPLAVNLDLGPK
jgi:hypothetical protein